MGSPTDVKKILELTLLWEVTKALNGKCSPDELIMSLNHIFQVFLRVNNVKIWIMDEPSQKIKDFGRLWHDIENRELEAKLHGLYLNLKKLEGKGFLVNNQELLFEATETAAIDILKQSGLGESNTIYLPLIDKCNIFGLIEINCPYFSPNIFTVNFLICLNIALMQISTAIVNIRLKEDMELKVDFQCLMKEIAKIIEAQYEPKYVVPLIGEMIDKFVSGPLIYIFGKDIDDTYSLVWPVSYSGRELGDLFAQADATGEFVISCDQTVAVFPMIIEENVIGAFVADAKIGQLKDKELHYLEQLTRQASITIEKSTYYAETLKQASLDALTGLNNRRQLEIRLEQETSIARRKKSKLCCIMIDIDYFKKINDNYGHSVGDKVLVDFAAILREELRTYDTAARYGGEEFCVLLPDTDIEKATIIADRLRETVENSLFEAPSYGQMITVPVTISIGISQYDLSTTESRELYEQADAALYQAKRTGRNRVIVYNGSSN